MIGKIISHYRIIDKLASGGMGVLYKAEDTKLRRVVALKFLPPDLARDEDAKTRFIHEAQAASALQHHNICTVHEVSETPDGQIFICMDYYEGETLKERIARGPLEMDDAVDVTIQLATGLAKAHDAGIVHRDIKPANIMVTSDGVLKILDFGVAKLAGAAGLTKTGTTMGTVAYMSPEQMRGDKIDHRSDIWSLGVVLYEMVTGRRPFRGDHGQAVVYSILNDSPVPITEFRPECPSGVQRLVDKMLAKTPVDRYESVVALLADLERCRRDPESLSTPGPSPAEGVERPARARRRSWAAISLAALLLLFAGLWLGHRAVGPIEKQSPPSGGRIPTVAVLPFLDMSPEQNQLYFSDGLTEELINYLASIKGLRVASRTASFRFRDSKEDLNVIGQKLNVTNILEGSVRKEGQKLKITAQLIDAANGFHLWSETYDRNLDDIFSVQADIARSVAISLKVTLVGAASPRGTNAEAYEAYLRARYFTARPSREGVERALGFYREAIKLDSTYAPAWVGLSSARSFQANLGWEPLEESVREARKAAEHAVELDPDLADAHMAVGWIRMSWDWDWKGAASSFQRALTLAPANSRAIGYAAMLAGTAGRFEDAITLDRRGLELDPLNGWNYHILGLHCFFAGRWDDAAAALKTALSITPEQPGAHLTLGEVYLAQGNPAQALSEMERENVPNFRLFGLALVYHALGREKESNAALQELIVGFHEESAYQVAQVYAARGEADQTFEWLDRAYRQRDGGLADAKGSPYLKKLEDDSRYAAFLKKLELLD